MGTKFIDEMSKAMVEPREEIGNAEQVVDQAYQRLNDYAAFALKNLTEARARVEHWENEYKIIQRFLATDQSNGAKEREKDTEPDFDDF